MATDFWLCISHHGGKVTFFATPCAAISPAHQSTYAHEFRGIGPSEMRSIVTALPSKPMAMPLIYTHTDNATTVLHWLDIGRRVLADLGEEHLAKLFGIDASAPVSVPVDTYAQHIEDLKASGAVYWLQSIDDAGKPFNHQHSEIRPSPDTFYMTSREVLDTMLPNVGLWRCLTKPKRTTPVLIARWRRTTDEEPGEWVAP